jgi:hypothetical protein
MVEYKCYITAGIASSSLPERPVRHVFTAGQDADQGRSSTLSSVVKVLNFLLDHRNKYRCSLSLQ